GGGSVAAERLAVAGAERLQARFCPRDDERFAPFQRSGDRPERQRALPALHAARSIQPAQQVVERHEVHRTVVGGRKANRVRSSRPPPLDLAASRVQTIEGAILRSEKDEVISGED